MRKIAILMTLTALYPVYLSAQTASVRTGSALSCLTEQRQLSQLRVAREAEVRILDQDIQKRIEKLNELRARANALVPVIYETRCCR